VTPFDRDSYRYPANSRYYGIAFVTVTLPDGREVRCLERRFVPDPSRLAAARLHEVVDGDRLDLLAATYLADPELGWRIADANRAMRPADLTATQGRKLRIPLPDGVPGGSNA
jgi:hypothetical protein